MCDLDSDRPVVWTALVRKARKEHRCCACRETISPGHRYHASGGMYDDGWESFKHCGRCWTILQHLSGRGAIPDVELGCGETYLDVWGEDPPPEIAALAFWRPGDPLPGELGEDR